MKIFLKIFVYFLAVLGALSINRCWRAGNTRSPETHSLANMSSAGTAAKLYSVKMKEETGVGSFPKGNSTEIAKALIGTGALSDANVINDNGEIVDSWGTPLYFVSTGEELCIISWGEDRERDCFDNHIIVMELPLATLGEK